MADPASASFNRYYSQEFFQTCAEKLHAGGVFAFQLASAENIWPPLLAYRNASIYRALQEVFKDILVIPGVTNTFIASMHRLERDPAVLAARFSARHPVTRLMSTAYLQYLYTNDRFGEINERLKSLPAQINTDYRPICFQYSNLIWLSRFFPSLIHRDAHLLNLQPGLPAIYCIAIGCLGLYGLVNLIRARPLAEKMFAVGLAGFIGIVLESILLLCYQISSGALYQDLGLLLTLFMVGLAVGSVGMDAVFNLSRHDRHHNGGRLRKWLFAGLGFVCAIIMAMMRYQLPANLISIGFLIFATGFIVAGVFADASLQPSADPGRMISPLYVSDLMGGCLGSLLGSILLVPFLGIPITSALLGLIAVTMALAS
jgi:spermidine synthase